MRLRNLPSFGTVARLAAEEALRTGHEIEEFGDHWPPEAVHHVRVLCKRLRAAVHLGAGLVPKETRERWNERLSHAARLLAVVRDGQVLSEWIIEVAPEAPPALHGPLARMAARLEAECGAAPDAAACREAKKTLLAVGRSWPRSWGLVGNDPDRGLARSTDRVRALGDRARSGHDQHDWHRWRRWVKYLAYQIQWIESAKGRRPGKRYRRLRKLGTTLGRINDMHNMLAWLAAHRFHNRSTAFLRHRARETIERLRREADDLAGD